MTLSHDLHPLRFARTRPYSRKVIEVMRGRDLHSEEAVEKVQSTVMPEMIQHYNGAIMQVPFGRRPSNTRFLTDEMGTAMKAAAWFWAGRHVFVLSDGLHQALARTDLSGVRVSDVQFPYDHFYLSLAGRMTSGLPGSDNVIDGAYISRVANVLEITLTTRRQGAAPDNPKRWPWNRDPTFYVPLMFGNDDPTFEELLERSIDAKEIDISPPTYLPDTEVEHLETDRGSVEIRNVSKRNDALQAAEKLEAMPVVREALALVVNTLAWLTAKPEDASGPLEWTSDAPAGKVEATKIGSKRQREIAVADLLNGRFARIRVLGTEVEYIPPGATGADGRELSESFWRRGHWRRQAHGIARMLRRLQWIRPTLVRPDLGEPSQGHIYTLGPDGPAASAI